MNTQVRGVLCAVASAVLFGTMPFFAKTAYSFGANSASTAFARLFVGALVTGTAALVTRKPLRLTKEQVRRLVPVTLFYAATPMLLYAAYQLVDTGLVSALHFTYPVMVMLLGLALFRAKPEGKQLVCMALCVGGVLCLCRFGEQTAGAAPGIVMALLSGTTFAAYIVLLGKSGLRTLPLMTLTFWVSGLASLEIAAFSLARGELVLALPWQVWAAWAALGVLTSAAALALFQQGVFLCGEVRASLLSTFEPLTGVILGAIVFHEAITGRDVAGILLILAAAALLTVPVRAARRGGSGG